MKGRILMDSFTCPFCNHAMSLHDGTFSQRFPSAKNDSDTTPYYENTLCVEFYVCPRCNETSIIIKGVGSQVEGTTQWFRPNSLAKKYPSYIPSQILQDYEEACAIVNLSPKASATLSRRCLQGMIRDYWGINKPRLVDEIDALRETVPATQWKVIDSLRRIGNIGAHPEADVNSIIDIEPTDASKLIKVIELLIDQWYIERDTQNRLFDEIAIIDAETRAQRNIQG